MIEPVYTVVDKQSNRVRACCGQIEFSTKREAEKALKESLKDSNTSKTEVDFKIVYVNKAITGELRRVKFVKK